MTLKLARKQDPARMFDVLWDNWRQAIALGFLGGNEVTVVGAGTGSFSKTVRHGLGRAVRGFLFTRLTNAVIYYESSSDATEITFEGYGFASGAWSVTVRVF